MTKHIDNLVAKALETRSIYRLAKDLGVCYHTAWDWAKGRRNPSPLARMRLALLIQDGKEEK